METFLILKLSLACLILYPRRLTGKVTKVTRCADFGKYDGNEHKENDAAI